LGYQTVTGNFRLLVVPFNKALFFVANSGYFTVFTPHIYFIILISMIASNLVEIRLDFQRCKAENVFGSLISTRLDRQVISLPLASTQGIFSFHDV
jgi:hypothetical protein